MSIIYRNEDYRRDDINSSPQKHRKHTSAEIFAKFGTCGGYMATW